jgi:hypothetical protein
MLRSWFLTTVCTGVLIKVATKRCKSNPHSIIIFFLLFFGARWYLSSLCTSVTIWPIVPAPDDRWWMWSSPWNENCQGKPKYLEKTRPSATLFTTDSTWPDLGSNPDRRDGKPATNRLNYGTSHSITVYRCSGLIWFCPRVKWLEREADHSSPSVAEVKNVGPIPHSPIHYITCNNNDNNNNNNNNNNAHMSENDCSFGYSVYRQKGDRLCGLVVRVAGYRSRFF